LPSHRRLRVEASGQHGIGGRPAGREGNSVIRICAPGQRVGSMGSPNRDRDRGWADDVGWLNAGAEIIIHGNAGTVP
jgi:hypothetical protein